MFPSFVFSIFSMVRIQKRISHGQNVLSYFMKQQWTFETDNIIRLKKSMNAADKVLFPVTMENVNMEKLIFTSSLGVKRFILHEYDLEKSRKKNLM